MSFFFCSHRDRRDLHSFPTRRSSDLLPAPCRDSISIAPESNGTRSSFSVAFGSSHLSSSSCLRTTGIRSCSFAIASRSEEHTSELQSHVNLVCRLLLEKKKRHKPTTS